MSSSPQPLPQPQLPPKKAGGNVWIYVILVVVGIVFAITTITALVIAIQKRPRQLYLKTQPTSPTKEVFVVVFDESSVSSHNNSGATVSSASSGAVSSINNGTTPFLYPSSPGDVAGLKNLIISGSTLEPFNGIASQIGKDLAIAKKSDVEEAVSKGAVFKYLLNEATDTTSGSNYVNLPFLIDESFSTSSDLSSSSNAFYVIDDSTSPPTLKTSAKPAGSSSGDTTRLAIAFYGVKPNFGDFVTRQYSTRKHPNNPTASYLKVDATDYLPSATFKAPWIDVTKLDAVYVYSFRIVPFNSSKFNDFVTNDPSKYEAKGADGRIKWWSANYTE